MNQRWLLMGIVMGGVLVLRYALSRRATVDLNGKVVIVTGASAGIGKATAHAFAAQGAKLVLVARRAEVLLDVAQELDTYGTESLVVPTDVSDPDALESLVAEVMRTCGRIDVLVNNAGIDLGGPFQEQDPLRLRRLVEINVYGPLRLTQLALPVMLRQGNGHIVNVSSITGRVPSPGMAAYGATRAGVISFTDALRRELDGTGIRVSLVLPTWTRTAMVPEPVQAEVKRLFWQIDAPEVPAAAIVDAVCHNRREIVLGGPLMAGALWLERHAPRLMDLWWRVFVLSPNYLEAMSHLGE